jgi:hypothetical protein
MVIRAGTVALKWAFNREMIEKDASAGIIWFSGKTKERQILSSEQAAAVQQQRARVDQEKKKVPPPTP